MRCNPLATAACIGGLLVAYGCEGLSPIKQADCKIEKVTGDYDNGRQPGQVEQLIFDSRTGEMYEYDEFSEKLERLNGVTEKDGITFSTESLIVGNKWKMKMSFDDPKKSDPPDVWTFEIDLSDMKFKESNKSGITFQSKKSEGSCVWSKPKTTMINRK